MALPRGLNIAVFSNNQYLQMYNDPDAEENEEPDKRTRYIESTTGAKFELHVTLDSSFEWGPSDAVRVVVEYDGATPACSHDLRKTSLPENIHLPIRAKFTSVHRFCQMTKQWKLGLLSFGALQTKESTDVRTDMTRLDKIGSIRVIVQRVMFQPHQSSGFSDEGYQRITEVSEKMLKGKAISNSVDCVDQRPAARPRNAAPVLRFSGDMGKSYMVDILYRSRPALQMLGCIPRTPSPESEDEDNATDSQTEIQQLRSRLALLERDRNIKSETADAIRIKRERADTDAGNGRKRSRRSGSIEVVDLTGV